MDNRKDILTMSSRSLHDRSLLLAQLTSLLTPGALPCPFSIVHLFSFLRHHPQASSLLYPEDLVYSPCTALPALLTRYPWPCFPFLVN